MGECRWKLLCHQHAPTLPPACDILFSQRPTELSAQGVSDTHRGRVFDIVMGRVSDTVGGRVSDSIPLWVSNIIPITVSNTIPPWGAIPYPPTVQRGISPRQSPCPATSCPCHRADIDGFGNTTCPVCLWGRPSTVKGVSFLPWASRNLAIGQISVRQSILGFPRRGVRDTRM